ncbi:MAG: hypothetical protein E6G97_09865 [Alphaproteobacteria bacterium]|nr:MAG: hypothetical protein E6G97_09865 [Alphaproteobacteria bacterium]
MLKAWVLLQDGAAEFITPAIEALMHAQQLDPAATLQGVDSPITQSDLLKMVDDALDQAERSDG